MNQNSQQYLLDLIVSLVDADNVLLYVLDHNNIGQVDLLDIVVSLLRTKDLSDVLHQSPLD